LYGAGLGVGFFTYLAHGTLVVVGAAAFAGGRPALGALLVAPFGLVRGLSAATAWDATSPERGRALVDRLAAIPDGWRRRANGTVLLAAAVLAVAAARASAPGGWWQLAAAALAATFGWAAAAKIVAPRRWVRALGAHGLPAPVARGARWGVPVAEAIVALLVVLGRPRAAATWALVLLAGFTVELVRIRPAAGGRVPCGCLGSRATIRVRTALLRNAALAALAVGVVVLADPDGAIVGLAAPGAADAMPLVLAAGSAGAGVLLVWRAIVWLSPERGRPEDAGPAARRFA
jgi:hypothetical protein